MEEIDIAARIEALERASDEPILLRGRYEPLEVAARGGEGDVVRAWDHQHGRPVALKIRPMASGGDDDRVLAEARTLLALRAHPNIAVARDDFFESGKHHLVLDWIAGEDLRTRLRREGAPGLPFDTVVAAIADVAGALDHVHGHVPPVFHGDVKPANIIVTDDDTPRAVLVDFGSATDGVTRGATVSYVAPEVANTGEVGVAADIYSLAATTFELLTGRVATPGVTLDWSGVPGPNVASVRSALVDGLALDPRRRPPSASAFVSRLTSGTRPDRTSLGGRPRGSTSRLRIGGGLVAAALLGAAGSWAVVDRRDAPETAAASVDGEVAAAPSGLPAGETRLGRLGVYTTRGVFETYAVGDAGTVALEHRQEGLTHGWTTIEALSSNLLLFYRARDAAVGIIDWAADGAVLDLYSPGGFVTGYSHATVVREGMLHLYDSVTGAATTVPFDAEGNLGAQVADPTSTAGWTHLTRLADGSILHYDAATGTAQVRVLDAAGAVTDITDLQLPADLTDIDGVAEGVLVAGARAERSMTLLSVDDEGAREVDRVDLDHPWTGTAPVGGRIVVYDAASGNATVVAPVGEVLTTHAPSSVLADGAVLIGRP